METRTPITVITGPLGGGKTTLLRHLLNCVNKKIAIVMNEFGDIAIDSKIIEGKSVRMAELGGGCVCCSLVGEFEAAVNEIIDSVHPECILLETTGLAEPDALVFDIQANLPRVRLDGVISVVDADGLLRFPSIGHTGRVQIEAADLILLNKIDLVGDKDLNLLEEKLRAINKHAPIVRAIRCGVDVALLFGLVGKRKIDQPEHVHQLEFESFSYSSPAIFDRGAFEQFVHALAPVIYRAKGFVRCPEGTYLFNFVNGRWELEPFRPELTNLVFIGKEVNRERESIVRRLLSCERSRCHYQFLEDKAIADIAFEAWGANLEELFIAARDATMNAMIENLAAIEPRESRTVTLEHEALDLLLFNFLQEFIYYKDSEQLLLRASRVQIENRKDQYVLSAEARGEKLDAKRHHQRVDVKAVTLHEFKLEKTDAGWKTMVTLDI